MMELDLKEFSDWAKERGRAEYEYTEPCGCPLYEYLTFTGAPVKSVTAFDWCDITEARHPIPHDVAAALVASPNTFSALVRRLNRIVRK